MRTTVSVDDDLMEQTREITGINESAQILREALKALKALIEREAARQLAQLGGSMPDLEVPSRKCKSAMS